MGLFSKDEDYNLELKKAIEDWINASELKRGFKVNNIKKYANKKLKKEKGFSQTQLKMLKDMTGSKRIGLILDYDISQLKLMHLTADDYRNTVIEKLTTEGVPVIFPKIDKEITNNLGLGAVGGGLLFGATGAVVGGALGASNQKVNDKIVRGEVGKLKVAEKGIVVSNNVETLKIPWKDVKEMKNNMIELKEGKHLIFYEIYNYEIISRIVNKRSEYIEEDGW